MDLNDYQTSLRHIKANYADATEMTKALRQKLEVEWMALTAEFLTQDGIEEDKVKHYEKELFKLFSKESLEDYPDGQWLESSLYPESSSWTCKQTCSGVIKLTVEKLLNPPSKSAYMVNGTHGLDDLAKQLRHKSRHATTLTEKMLLSSLLSSIASLKKLDRGVSRANPEILKIMSKALPFLATGFCASFFLSELALFFSFAIVMSKSGGYLQKTSFQRCQSIGRQIDQFGSSIASLGLSLIMRVTQFNTIACHNLWTVSKEAGAGFFNVLGMIKPSMAPEYALIKGIDPYEFNFKCRQLRALAIPLIFYSKEQSQQYFAGLRLGDKKSERIIDTVKALREIDASDVDLDEKLQLAGKELHKLQKTAWLNVEGSNANKVIARVLMAHKAYLPEKQEKGITCEGISLFNGTNLFNFS